MGCFSDHALSQHSVGNLLETSDVGAHDVVLGMAILLGSLVGALEDVLHDALQLGVHFLEAPRETLAVLGHFQSGGGCSRGGDTAR